MCDIFRFFPRPISDILGAPCAVTNWVVDGKLMHSQACIPSRKFLNAIQRTTLAAAGAFVLYSLWNTYPAFMLISAAVLAGSVLSIPATIISAGSFLTYYAVSQIVQAIALESVFKGVIGVTAFAAGWIILQNHDLDELSRGLMEKFIKKFSENHEDKVSELFFRMCCCLYSRA